MFCINIRHIDLIFQINRASTTSQSNTKSSKSTAQKTSSCHVLRKSVEIVEDEKIELQSANRPQQGEKQNALKTTLRHQMQIYDNITTRCEKQFASASNQ